MRWHFEQLDHQSSTKICSAGDDGSEEIYEFVKIAHAESPESTIRK